MDKAAMPEGKYLASVKLGPKGQIVVPKEVREMFGVRPGDTLLLLAEPAGPACHTGAVSCFYEKLEEIQ